MTQVLKGQRDFLKVLENEINELGVNFFSAAKYKVNKNYEAMCIPLGQNI